MATPLFSLLPRRFLLGVLGFSLAASGAGACAAGPRTLDALEQARAAVVRAENSAAGRFATDQLMESVKTLGQAEAAYFEAPRAISTVDLAQRAQRQAEEAIVRGEAARREQQAAPAGLSKLPMETEAAADSRPARTHSGIQGGATMGAAMPVKREPQ